MPDIVTSKTFVDGEKGITATKLNQIISGSVIQPSFFSAKPSTSTLDPTDLLLDLKGAGTYATITGSQLISSVSSSVTQNITPTIWSVRQNSFSSVGNPNLEIDQRTIGAAIVNAPQGSWLCDRWRLGKVGTYQVTTQRMLGSAGDGLIPGTSYAISNNFLRITLTTSQATLGATDQCQIWQAIEGAMFRELSGGVHSLSLIVRSSVSGLVFSVSLQDNTTSKSLNVSGTIPSANTWTLLSFPNLPVWASGGTWTANQGALGYYLLINLACGLTLIAPAANTWQNGNYQGAPGQSNFVGSSVGSTFDLGFVQHEPGNQCSTPMDSPFVQNYDACLRYYQKTYEYATAPGTASVPGYFATLSKTTNAAIQYNYGRTLVKPMAKIPTVVCYGYNPGTANTVTDISGVNRSVTSVDDPSTKQPFADLTLAAAAAGGGTQLHYTADTGW